MVELKGSGNLPLYLNIDPITLAFTKTNLKIKFEMYLYNKSVNSFVM